MPDAEFKSFPKIANIEKSFMTITEKINGTNACIYIYKNKIFAEDVLELRTASRNRWIAPGGDNHGFASFIYENKNEFIEKLGEGRHFGEWFGGSISSGYNLKEKYLALFNWRRWKDIPLPGRVTTVPVLHSGKFSTEAIDEVMLKLKADGSRISPGFMKPEGVVIEIDGHFYKKTFENEEVAWKGEKRVREREEISNIDISHLLQPIRLEKLLLRDERYKADYPRSLSSICQDYVKDLEEEGCITGNEEEIKGIKKFLGKQVFKFVRHHVENINE